MFTFVSLKLCKLLCKPGQYGNNQRNDSGSIIQVENPC
jgi:hypothetical protein